MISVIVTTYGPGTHWQQIARDRAIPSARSENPYEVIVHHEAKLEIGPARNRAAEQASGEWLLFLNADDELGEGYIQAMTDAICAKDRPEPALLQPSVRFVRNNNYRVTPMVLPETDLSHENYLVIGTVLRRSLFKKAGGFGDYPHGFETWALWHKCWKLGAKTYPVPNAVYNAHINPQSKRRRMWRNPALQIETHAHVQEELAAWDPPE